MRDLPPLKALRAFEACYRLRSYTRAADQLNVGQPAISHQIRQLERDLGTVLFIKRGSRIEATPDADSYFEVIAPALSRIADASRSLRHKPENHGLTLATYPGLAAYWVMPRLGQHPDLFADCPVTVTTMELDAEVDFNLVDCAILFGSGNWAGDLDYMRLISEEVVPVTSPALAGSLTGHDAAALLAQAPLIHLQDPERRWFDWQHWRDHFAPNQEQINTSLTVTNHGLAIYQALQGQGVALGWTGVIRDLLNSGALVPVFPEPLSSDRAYWLIARSGFLDSDRGQRLLSCLTEM
ncbi:LysR substrate-binding domain-containing protein [Coralliovum pocilloporae]|uniref:LysR substrate-binding domain-containing protein n=1 Tax=Coralliovum pocilloporae TaxID=3066369 RepID=UPI0033079F91